MTKTPWIKKIVIAALAAEVIYVILFNLALQLPLTQTLINQIRPDKFHVTWENAWTWYPFRFHIRDASGNGQARSQQWAFEVKSVSASIDVVPLIFKRVWIDGVRVSDANYYQRPRLKADKDYTELLPFYPSIGDREVSNAVTIPKKKKRAWHVEIDDIKLDGQFAYWIHQFKGQATGTLNADLNVVSRGGLLSLSVPDINLELDPHSIKSRELFHRGLVSGEMGLAPFVPRDNKGIKFLRFLLVDADVNINANDLSFIDLYTQKFKDMSINGTGLIDGHLSMEAGKVLQGTDLSIDAGDLDVNLFSHRITGDGAIKIGVRPDPGDELDLGVRFNNMVILQSGATAPLVTGEGLIMNATATNQLRVEGSMVNATATNQLLRTEGDTEAAGPTDLSERKKKVRLELIIPTARVSDMSVFNHYLPADSPVLFTSGNADLTADIMLKHDDAEGFVRLKASQMEALVDTQLIRTDFSADISLVDGKLGERFFDISGSEFRLDNVKVVGQNEEFNQKDWDALLVLNQAKTVLVDPIQLITQATLSMTDSRPIVATLGNQKGTPKWAKKMLTVEDINGTVEMQVADRQLTIPNAFLDSDNIEFGAKGVFAGEKRDAVIYARYKKLDILVKISNNKKNIDLTRTRQKFDDYHPPTELK